MLFNGPYFHFGLPRILTCGYIDFSLLPGCHCKQKGDVDDDNDNGKTFCYRGVKLCGIYINMFYL